MQPKDSETFRFGRDDADQDEIMHHELQELKVEKLSHRLTLLTILLPCIIGIILVIAYLDIKDRVTRTYDTGTTGVQKLSRDMESKFSSLSLEQAKIKDILSKIPELENTTAFAQSRIKPMEKALKHLESSSINRDELSRVVERMNERFSSIPSNLKSELQNIKTADQDTAEKIEKISERLDSVSETLLKLGETVKKIDQNIAALEEQTVTKSELELALKLKEIAAKQTLLDTTAAFEKKIKGFDEALRALQKDVDDLKNNGNTSGTHGGSPTPAPKSGTAGKQASGSNTGSTSLPGSPAPGTPPPSTKSGNPDQIIEQNIE
jgi:peptidoglycan hydrolase CwlO-like protein